MKLKKIASFTIELIEQAKPQVFESLRENEWLNFSSGEKWCKWCFHKGKLKLLLAEVWSDNNVSLMSIVVPNERNSIIELIKKMNEEKQIDGCLTNDFKWLESDVEENQSDTESSIIYNLCLQIGEVEKEKPWKTILGVKSALRSFGITTVRPFGFGSEIDLYNWGELG